MAGQQLMERLRKMQADDGTCWVEALPIVIDRLHDVPGESGLSPYEIFFGRERPLGNLSSPQNRDCEDALDFFQRQEEVDKKVAKGLDENHRK